jgi:predicted fused transcriptional regulator/phosphomethylpyrimidine kinase
VIHKELVKSVGNIAYKLNTVKHLVTKFKSGYNVVEDGRGCDTSDVSKKNVIDEIKELLTQTRGWKKCIGIAIFAIPYHAIN